MLQSLPTNLHQQGKQRLRRQLPPVPKKSQSAHWRRRNRQPLFLSPLSQRDSGQAKPVMHENYQKIDSKKLWIFKESLIFRHCEPPLGGPSLQCLRTIKRSIRKNSGFLREPSFSVIANRRQAVRQSILFFPKTSNMQWIFAVIRDCV